MKCESSICARAAECASSLAKSMRAPCCQAKQALVGVCGRRKVNDTEAGIVEREYNSASCLNHELRIRFTVIERPSETSNTSRDESQCCEANKITL
jgi:hypothetical protein